VSDFQAALALAVAGLASIMWAWFKVTSSKRPAAPSVPPVDRDMADKAAKAIKAASETVQAEIEADLRGDDPAGDLADRANRRRR
jgi:hypothetical protein